MGSNIKTVSVWLSDTTVPTNFPSTDTIRVLAEMFYISHGSVVLMLAKWLGLQVGEVEFSDLLPAAVDDLPPLAKEEILAFVQDVVHRYQTQEGGTSQ